MEATEATTITEDLNIPSESPITNDLYVVGYFKLAILFSCTIGIYLPYWFYRQWKQQKSIAGVDCWPIMRGIFLIFFTHPLLESIDKKLRLNGKEYDWKPQHVAGVFAMLVFGLQILDRLYLKGIGLPYTDLGGWLVLAIIGILLIYIQRMINIACNDIEGASNRKFTALNFLWITIGIMLIMVYLFS